MCCNYNLSAPFSCSDADSSAVSTTIQPIKKGAIFVTLKACEKGPILLFGVSLYWKTDNKNSALTLAAKG